MDKLEVCKLMKLYYNSESLNCYKVFCADFFFINNCMCTETLFLS